MKSRDGQRCGLECGATSAKLVLLGRSKSGVCVEKCVIEQEPFELRIKGHTRPRLEIVRQLLIHQDLTGYRTVLSDDDASGCCFVLLPVMNKPDLEGAILLQARKLLSCETPAPIMAHMDSEFSRDRVGSVVGLSDWKNLKNWCKLVESSGGIVEDVTIAACAYQALARRQKWADQYPVFLVADFGAASSRFYVFDNRMTKFFRQVPVGGDAITKSLATEISLEKGPIRLGEADAEEFKIAGNLSRAEMLMRPSVERMSSEVMRSIQFFKENSGQKVEAVFITGGSTCLQFLKTHLETTIPLPVKVIDPFADMDFSNIGVGEYAEKNKARLAIATGLALSEQPPVSLLPKAVQMSKKFSKYAFPAVVAMLFFGFLIPMVIGTYKVIRIQHVRSVIEKHKKEISTVKMGQDELDRLRGDMQKSSDYLNNLRALIVKTPLWSGVLNALADAVPRDILLTSFAVNFTEGGKTKVLLHGRVLSSGNGFDNAVSGFLSKLSSSIFFDHVSLASADASQTDGTLGSFVIQCEIIY